jgi:hypothetical protein
MTDNLEIPAFLLRPRGTQPIHLLLANLGRRRWKVRKVGRPEGKRWEHADLVEVFLFDEATTIGCGLRRLWVSEGRKWCKLAGMDGAKAKIPMKTWGEIVRRSQR